MLDTGCCGTNLKQDRVHIIGATLIAYPLFILSLLIRLISLPLFKTRLYYYIKTLNLAAWRVIQDLQVIPLAKCKLSAKLYPISSHISGFCFKTFNFVVVSFLWAFCFAVYGGVKYVL